MIRFLYFLILIPIFIQCKKDNVSPTVTSGAFTLDGNNLSYLYYKQNAAWVSPDPNIKNDSVQVSIYSTNITNCTIKVILGKDSFTSFNGIIKPGTYNQELYFQNYSEGVVYVQVKMNDKLWEYPLFLRK